MIATRRTVPGIRRGHLGKAKLYKRGRSLYLFKQGYRAFHFKGTKLEIVKRIEVKGGGNQRLHAKIGGVYQTPVLAAE